MRLLDSHVHFWRIGGPGQVWPDADWPVLHRDFLPADLHGETGGLDLTGCVVVQAQPDDRDTDWLLTLDDPSVRAVVGWVDDHPFVVLQIEVTDGLVDQVFLVRNPDKLTGVMP